MSDLDEKIITLRKPLSIGSGENRQEYTDLKLREPTAGELEAASRADTGIGTVINLLHQITRIPRKALEGMSQRDLKECGDFLESFNDEPPQTSGTSSPTSPVSTGGGQEKVGT